MTALRKYTSLIVLSLTATLANAITYPEDANAPHPAIYVASDGSDSQGDGSLNNPFKSLEKSASKVKNNNKINGLRSQDILVKGGSYPPQKFNNVIGAPGAITTIKLMPGTGRVLIDGTVSLTDLAQGNQWQTTSDANIYSLQLAKTDNMGAVIDIWQLFSNNQIMTPARWPNALLSNGSAYSAELTGWAQVNDGVYDSAGQPINGSHINKVVSSPSTNLPADLASSAANATGGVAILNTGSWQSWARKVTSHTAGSNVISHENSANTDDKVYNKGHMKFFVEGAYGLMDSNQEWYYDETAHIVYLYTTETVVVNNSVQPKHWQTMRGKVAGEGLYSYGNEFVDIRNIDFYASIYKCLNCSDVRLFSTDFIFGGSAKRMLKGSYIPENSVAKPDILYLKSKHGTDKNSQASNFVLQNCTITDTDAQAFFIQGNNTKVSSCSFNNIDYSAAKGYEPQGALVFKGYNNTISHSTISNSGTSHGVVSTGGNYTVEYSELFNTGFAQEDGGALQVRSGQQYQSVLRYNWIHDQRQGKGIRMDAIYPAVVAEDYGFGSTIYNNVVWNSGGIAVKGREHSIFNNTSFDNTNSGAGDILLLDEKNYHPYSSVCEQYGCSRDSVVVNNIANNISTARKEYTDPAMTGWIPQYLNNFNGNVTSTDIRAILRDVDARDFRLKSTATAYISTGIEIPTNPTITHVIEQERSSTNLEYGAYEYGMGRKYWVPGFTQHKPSSPIPSDAAVDILKSQDLIWRHAYEAQEYHVYLATDLTSVESATQTDSSGIYRGKVPFEDNSFRAGSLVGATTYYWRIDTVKWGTVIKGNIFSFTTKA